MDEREYAVDVGRGMPLPRIETLYVPAPALTHTVVLRDVRVAVGFPGSPRPAPPDSPSRPHRSPGAGRARIPPLPSVAEVFDHLHGRLRSELTTRSGGMP
jgi:hypothetical protein